VVEKVTVSQQMNSIRENSLRHKVFYIGYTAATGAFPVRYTELGSCNSLDEALALLENQTKTR
jgi:hypothetical protein